MLLLLPVTVCFLSPHPTASSRPHSAAPLQNPLLHARFTIVSSQTFISLSSVGLPSYATPASLPAKSRNWHTLILNDSSISGKRTELANIMNYMKPDAAIITQTKLDASIKRSEFMSPVHLQPKHKDHILLAVAEWWLLCATAILQGKLTLQPASLLMTRSYG